MNDTKDDLIARLQRRTKVLLNGEIVPDRTCAEAADRIAALTEQVEGLTRERDEARAMPSDETARAFIAAWREKYPGAGFPTLGDAKEMLAATFGVVNYSENNDLQEAVLSCRTLDDLKATQQTILAMRALTT